jgi:7-carboxy-7-deazaguanine synthase
VCKTPLSTYKCMQADDTNTVAAKADSLAKVYRVNEIFFSVQGEGNLMGTPMVFVRFAECNLRCSISNAGFDCDTEFASYRERTASEIVDEVTSLNPKKGWILFTGGEPGLQLDDALIQLLRGQGWKLAIETNGTVLLPEGLDWICVSPKTAEHTLRQKRAHELKYVRRSGMALPQPSISAEHYLISPAFQADGSIRREDLEWCIGLVKQEPETWRLTLQSHKLLGVR